jgi:hypothetical protein
VGMEIEVFCADFVREVAAFNADNFAAITENFSYELNKKKISLMGFPLVGFSRGIAQKFSCAKCV